jgi:hypothetical protein
LAKIEADSGADVNRHSGAGAKRANPESRGYQLEIPGLRQVAHPGMTGAIPYLTPVPLQRWHFTTLSPFLTRPLPSQFLHFCFFLMFGPLSLAMLLLSAIERITAVMRHILRQTTAKMI